MITRSELRQALQAIKKEWPTPLPEKLKIRDQAQAVLDSDSPDVFERWRDTAREVLAAIERVDWCETMTQHLR